MVEEVGLFHLWGGRMCGRRNKWNVKSVGMATLLSYMPMYSLAIDYQKSAASGAS